MSVGSMIQSLQPQSQYSCCEGVSSYVEKAAFIAMEEMPWNTMLAQEL